MWITSPVRTVPDDDHSRVEAAQAELATGRGVHEAKGVAPEARRELVAAAVGLIGHLDHGGADPQPRAGRKVGRAEVEVDVQLVAGEGPALGRPGHEQCNACVHHVQLHVGVGPAVGGPAARAQRPGVADEALVDVELALGQDLALGDRRTPHDQLDAAVVGGRTARRRRALRPAQRRTGAPRQRPKWRGA